MLKGKGWGSGSVPEFTDGEVDGRGDSGAERSGIGLRLVQPSPRY